MNRADMLRRAADRRAPWDLVVVGGGATGVGVAVDAAARGYAVLLLERHDFGKGTSSRSTKLVHGGVRYLAQGQVHLVWEALHERGLLLKNAPHVVHDLPFVVPAFTWWEKPFYGLGLTAYDLLAGRYRIGRAKLLSKRAALRRLPTLEPHGLRGGVVYHDGQFDDGRVLFAIPWHGHTLVGTTDVPIPEASPEPRPTDQEIDFILDTAGRYLAKPPTRADVLSTFAGVRPLVRSTGVTRTATLSREH